MMRGHANADRQAVGLRLSQQGNLISEANVTEVDADPLLADEA